MNYGQVSPGYGMQQPMQPQQIVVIQQQPMVQQPMMQQPVQQQVKHVEVGRGPQQRWANSGLGQTKNFWSGENPDQFFWSGIWSGGLAF